MILFVTEGQGEDRHQHLGQEGEEEEEEMASSRGGMWEDPLPDPSMSEWSPLISPSSRNL